MQGTSTAAFGVASAAPGLTRLCWPRRAHFQGYVRPRTLQERLRSPGNHADGWKSNPVSCPADRTVLTCVDRSPEPETRGRKHGSSGGTDGYPSRPHRCSLQCMADDWKSGTVGVFTPQLLPKAQMREFSPRVPVGEPCPPPTASMCAPKAGNSPRATVAWVVMSQTQTPGDPPPMQLLGQ